MSGTLSPFQSAFHGSRVEFLYFFIYLLIVVWRGGLLDGAGHTAGHLTCHRAPHPVRDALNDEDAAGGPAELTGGQPPARWTGNGSPCSGVYNKTASRVSNAL